MARLLLRNADWVVSLDKDRRIIRDGAVAILDDRIVDVGKTEDVERRFTADRVLDGSGKLALPGLIDTHVHNTQHFGRGWTDEGYRRTRPFERLDLYEQALTTEDAYWAARACQLELIKAGTTCFVDPSSYHPEATARALGETGMRGIVSRTAFDVASRGFHESTDVAIARAEEVITTLHGAHNGRLRAWFALRVLFACSDALCRQLKQLADKYGVGLVLHASESPDEIVFARMTWSGGDVERLDALGLLGPNMLLIHMGWATPREIALVKKHDLKVSFTPSTSYRMGFGDMKFGRFPEMLELGVTVALSSNAAMSSNFLDLVRVMSLTAGGLKSARLDPTILPPERVIEMATINGAKAALWDADIGSLERGKKGDMTLFDTRRPEWRPMLNPLSNLVYCCRGGADTVIIDGEVVMDSGVITTIDEATTLAECQRRAEAIAERAGVRHLIKSRWPTA